MQNDRGLLPGPLPQTDVQVGKVGKATLPASPILLRRLLPNRTLHNVHYGYKRPCIAHE